MNIAGLAAGYGGIVKGEELQAQAADRTAQSRQRTMEDAIKLRQMREMDAARKAQLEIGRQAPQEYAPITPGTTGYADAEKVAPAAPAAPTGAPFTTGTPTGGGMKPVRPPVEAPDRSIEISEMAKRLSSAQRNRQSVPVAPLPEGLSALDRAQYIHKERTGKLTPTDAQQFEYLRRMDVRVPVQPAEPSAAEGRMAKQLSDWQSEDAARGRGQADMAAAATARSATPATGTARSDRNNNPGNIRKSDISWAGKVPGTDAEFETFATPEAGFAAAQQNLATYQTKHGINTVAGVINRWSPPDGAGNTPASTSNYIRSVASALGVDPHQPLNLTDPATNAAMVRAMAVVERGGAQPVMAKLGATNVASGPAMKPELAYTAPASAAVTPEATYKATEIIDLSPRAAGLAQKRMEMLGRERQTYVSLMQASYDPAEQMKLRQAILGIDAGMAAADLTQLAAGAANGNREALVTLAQTTANQIGTKISVQDAGEGRVILTVAGRQQPPVTMAQASRQFHVALSEELQKTLAAAEAKNHAEATKQGYTLQRELAVETLKGQNARRTAAVTGQQQREGKLVDATLAMTKEAAKQAAEFEFGKGQYTLFETKDGALYMRPKSGMGVKRWVPGETGGQFSTDGEWVDTEQG